MQFNIIENSFINNVITDIYKKYNINNSVVSFDISSSYRIIDRTVKILKEEPFALKIDLTTNKSEFVIVGDIHGNLKSLISIFQKNGDPSTTKYLFLGDYVDRGNNSCEVIILLYAFKCLYPENIYLIRGNHEFRDMNDQYGFKNECFRRINSANKDSIIFEGSKFYEKITNSFQFLPICAILNDRIFCVHGGISGLIENREELMKIEKVGVSYCSKDSVAVELLWNDPDDRISTYKRSKRGIGCIFGNRVLNSFLNDMNFDLVIRAHQTIMDGYDWNFGIDGGILTVFSSIDYCGCSNDGAVALVSNDGNIKTMKFNCNPTILIPENIIENNFSFLDDATFNLDMNINGINDIPCFV